MLRRDDTELSHSWLDGALARFTADNDDLDAKFDGLKGDVTALRLSVESAKVWAVLLYVALAATMLGVTGRGFGWI